jgi:peptidoglycan/LPS O-acetylase OafA/YrhL
MVDFFFVLSGFVISLNYIDRINTRSQLYTFQKKRFLRLYPLHFLMLMVYVGIEFTKYLAETKLGLVANTPAFTENNWWSFLAHLFLIHNWTIPTLTFNYPSWSISAEFITYGIFALVLLLTSKSKTVFYSASGLLVVVAGILLQEHKMGTDNISGPLRCIFSFFIGIFTQLVYTKFGKNHQFKTSLLALCFVVLSILAVIYLGGRKRGLTIFVPFLFALTIYVLVVTDTEAVINRVLNHKFLVYLGTISYGIYMIHACMWWVWNQTMRLVLSFPTVIGKDGATTVLIENTYLADAIAISGVVTVIILAHFSYHLVEKRFNTSKTKTKPATSA